MISLFSKVNKSLRSDSSSSMDEIVDWSQLPIELWPKIGKYLDNHIDVLRFRSVCESFRSSIPPSHPNSPSFPLQIPHPVYNSLNNYVNQSTVYIIEPTDASSNSNLEPLAPSSSKGWLIKVEETKNQPVSLLSPISDRKLSYPLSNNNTSPMLWNLLDYRVIELCKSYKIEKTTPFSSSAIKVAFYPNSPWTSVEDCVACCIFQEGKLGLMKHGDEKWTLVDDKNFYYDDIIVFKGQFYVTDKWGTISWIDVSTLRLIQFSPPLCGFGNKKHLMESCGSLYVVDRYYEISDDMGRNYVRRRYDRDTDVECFKVYKLDEEWGKWVDVKNLRDRAFILSKSCNFSVSTKDLIGYQGNCIYFRDTYDARMYNLDDHRITMVNFNPCIDKTLWSRSPWMRC
ncbi:putative F-box domain-containing protein [Medicago truncatula]|uniref:F-box protein n=1 Tax=Medicago truncatula TaxID=3880 RepID=G7LA96_MEDTR|nr:F-box protein SKIP23 [Medicago truncatula]AET03687.1 F-box protein [Medicago truncatula]RHN41907.1 putative F-box domain-containing protein [Medicago truncatula]